MTDIRIHLAGIPVGVRPWVVTEDNLPSGFYVYVLVDPIEGVPFYVGKGIRDRCFHHMRDVVSGRVIGPRKTIYLARMAELGAVPICICIIDALSSPGAA